ncbi:MAG: cysteine desulfurase [Olsenella sp.]|nr:cysteine desulfurase [Olsenella sp.]
MTGEWRKDFPILSSKVYGHDLVYLDSAATSQMPRQVIERLTAYYEGEHANIHRGIHHLSEEATGAVERARARVAAFVGAEHADEVVFTSGATDSLNMAAFGMAGSLPAGSAVVVTDLEHHSNFVPWQQACEREGLEFLVCPSSDGELDLDALEGLLRAHEVRVVAVTQVSNAVGTLTPLERIAGMAHDHGAVVVVDGAQGILHEGVDVTAADVDFYAFSGHKMCAPTGIGVLYGKRRLLERLRPARFGGGMVDVVTPRETTLGTLPLRLEAGTPNIAGIIGLDAAIEYLEGHDLGAMRRHERELLAYATERLSSVEGVEILGHPRRRCGLVSFNLAGMHAFDVAFMLDKLGVAVRSGHHCAQPALRSLGVESSVRASIAFYNQRDDIDRLCQGLERLGALRR